MSDYMHIPVLKKYFPHCLLIAFLALSLITAFATETTYDSGDSIMHYLFSRYAFIYPEFFLHHWGKPLFILLSAPFTYFGFTGMEIFQCIVAFVSAWAAWRIGKLLQLEYAFLAIVFLYMMPDYFLAQFSGLTEPFFGLVLIASVFLYLRNNKASSLIILSFLPFARTEGIVIMIVFAVFLLFRKDFKYLPLLLAGFVLYSLIGYFYYDDILWVIHENPYRGAREIYGSGDILHFVKEVPFLIGAPLMVLIVIGIIGITKQLFTPSKYDTFFLERLFLIYGSVLSYFAAHSIFWWQGLFGSLGLTRVIIGIMPLMAVIALDGLDMLIRLIPARKLQFYSVLVAAAIVIIYPFQPNPAIRIPRDLNLTDEQELMNEVGMWYRNSPFNGKKVFYSHPYFSLALDKDHFDNTQTCNLKDLKYSSPADSSVIIWDKWFSGVETGVSIDSLLNDTCCTLIRTFEKPQVSDTLRYYVLYTN